jgi:hypothetical protein
MLKTLKPALLGVLALAVASPAFAPAMAQVKQTREQMTFYTAQWKGERFPDGRPRLPDDLLKRVLDVSVEDLWDYLRDKGYNCQFDTGFQMLHPDKPFAGRALTAQYMPLRRDMYDAIAAEGKRGRHPDRLQPGVGDRGPFPHRLCVRCRHPRRGGKPRTRKHERALPRL